MALNQKDPMLFLKIFYKLTPQLIKFNIPTNDWISFPALGGTGVFISGIVNPIINSVKFLFWVSIVTAITEILGDIWGIFNDKYIYRVVTPMKQGKF